MKNASVYTPYKSYFMSFNYDFFYYFDFFPVTSKCKRISSVIIDYLFFIHLKNLKFVYTFWFLKMYCCHRYMYLCINLNLFMFIWNTGWSEKSKKKHTENKWNNYVPHIVELYAINWICSDMHGRSLWTTICTTYRPIFALI